MLILSLWRAGVEVTSKREPASESLDCEGAQTGTLNPKPSNPKPLGRPAERERASGERANLPGIEACTLQGFKARGQS